MRQYASLFQRILSLVLIAGIVLTIALVGVVFLGYILVLGAVAFVVGWIYVLFKSKKTTIEEKVTTEEVIVSGHVEVGDFSHGPGRIIDHTEE
ncbi:MAG: hypothetical protein ACHQAX_00065 [Gammaproteobacteria bacterium]